MILINPFLVLIPSIAIASFLSLNNSLIDICKLTSPNETKVSPSKGALLMITNESSVTFALGKLFIKLKFTSEKLTFASTFSFIASAIFAFI